MHGLNPGSARRVTGLLGPSSPTVSKRKLRDTNPVHGLDKPADVKRMRRLSESEYESVSNLEEVSDGAPDRIQTCDLCLQRASVQR